MAHRELINKIKEEEYDEEEGTASVSFDGKQFVVRIPTSVAEAARVQKGDKVFFKAKIAPKPPQKRFNELNERNA